MFEFGAGVDELVNRSAPEPVRRVRRPNKPRPVLWATIALLVLAGSGLGRSWQDRRLADASERSEKSPFQLKDLPETLRGPLPEDTVWVHVKEADQRMDPEVAKIAGSIDNLVRTYYDEKTGVLLTLLIIYGKGQTLSQHVPEVCYPNVGYQSVDVPLDVSIPMEVEGAAPADFRSLIFTKSGAGVEDREEVHYAFRHDGRWYPDAAVDWKRFRYNPAMFKVQIQRRLAEHEQRYARNPSSDFLSKLLPVIETKLGATPISTSGTTGLPQSPINVPSGLGPEPRS